MVNFISFAAKATTTGVQLNWKIASETNHKQYIVSRSTNGKDYTIVTTTTAYSTTDNNVASGTYYYKLEQQDNDGTINQLAVQVVKVGLATNYLTVYPNPTKDIATVTLAVGAYTNYTVVGVQGNTVATGNINNTDTMLKVNLSSVAAGTYIIKLLGVNGNTAARVIKL
ncbi:T9SS type A sorting domain-containing protein [Pedobacter sp. SL55]|uniref:T9SS type A sorting domain-containing protein n=1 Tax=Pedobacter sp. SL55 TaxID=2995161 RepID=UPI00227129E8|nr:T9SS type A sorting domain-containing protein [Pedobacter sp. SL55]WAC41292.1 T9SS type A sorting domain-containing protein [Pedobacter sp. SL55]